MKNRITTFGLILFCSLLMLSLSAQKSSSLTPETLIFSDQANPLSGASFNIGGLNIINGFNYSSITDNAVSGGSDLLRAIIDGNGLTVRDFAVSPESKSNLNRKNMTFVTSGQGIVGLDEETWSLGITDVGVFDNGDPVQSALSLNYSRIIDDVAIFRPIFFVNPDRGNIGFGTFSQSFGAQVFVEENSQSSVGVWSQNTGASNGPNWGIYSLASGTGSGIRYGVVGQAQSSSGLKYGIFGSATGPGPGLQYAVFASGNLAYTGSFTFASDQKFKKNVSEFSALERVLKLQPKTYEMKRDEFKPMNLASGTQFGFIAQELREVFPELVHEEENANPYKEGQDSLAAEVIKYLGVDYISLVPVLTQAMQEQQQMIDDKDDRIRKLERTNQAIQQKNEELESRLNRLEILMEELSNNTSTIENTSTISLTDARLMQNQPNPFLNSTSIPYFVPEMVQHAQLRLTDANGRILKSIELPSRGKGQTKLETHQLSGGIYFYTLILDGKMVDTKKMVLVKD